MRRYSGPVKVKVCERLGGDWRELADFLEIPASHRAGFPAGREPHGIWEWLECRDRLPDLPGALVGIGRDDLAAELHAGRPRSAVLSVQDDPAARFRLLDTAFFDLSEIRDAIEEVLEGEPGPAAFVVAGHEEMYVGKLCEWLEHCVDDIRQRPAVSLNPLQGGVDRALRHIESLRPLLGSSSVLCRVNVHSPQAGPGDLTRFWDEVRLRFAGLDRWLLLLVQVHAADLAVDGMVPLPAPCFRRRHIRDWGRTLQLQLQWPPGFTRCLTDAVVDYAETDGELDIRLVYDALGGVVHDVRHKPDWIRDELERGSYVAHSAQS
ncbi:hypothetical protein [Dactylosporangium sp. CA-139066]|uniref:hypothetical protein n=1 Tax=Dactylosporangium sp. CA-139066 TaxID=3239930 RepID=UPI003D9111E3